MINFEKMSLRQALLVWGIFLIGLAVCLHQVTFVVFLYVACRFGSITIRPDALLQYEVSFMFAVCLLLPLLFAYLMDRAGQTSWRHSR